MAEGLPSGYDFDDEENPIPPGFRTLFPDDENTDLTKITESPPRMIIPLVRMRVINQAYNTKRTISLLEFFVREFDRRMISRDRRGRLEAVQMLQGGGSSDEDEEEASM